MCPLLLIAAGIFFRPSIPAVPSTFSPAQAVYVEPNPSLPGQAIRIHWPRSMSPVVLTGGVFGKKTIIKDRTWATDAPKSPTTYTVSALVKPGAPKARVRAVQAPTPAKPCLDAKASENDGLGLAGGPRVLSGLVRQDADNLRRFELPADGDPGAQPPARSVIVADVYPGTFPSLATYHDPRGWRVDVVAGWNRNVVDLDDPTNNALIYFQPEEDSIERLAVSIVPSDGMNCEQLMRKVETEIPTQYDVLTRTGLKLTTQGGIPASWMAFQGTDVSHPDAPSKSLVLAFILGPRGYVISGRAAANRFDSCERLLRCLIRSFAFEDPIVRPFPAIPSIGGQSRRSSSQTPPTIPAGR